MGEPLRYYFDEDMHPAIAGQLRARGIDVLTTAEAGRAGRGVTDQDQLAFATAHGRVLVTRDRDFIVLASRKALHVGIIHKSHVTGGLPMSRDEFEQAVADEVMSETSYRINSVPRTRIQRSDTSAPSPQP